jgi:hypothetical protein
VTDFDPQGMVAFQINRRRELAAYRAGDRRIEPPATSILSQSVNGRIVRYVLNPGRQRSLSEVWGLAPTRSPYGGKE